MKKLSSNLFDKKSLMTSDGMNKIYGGIDGTFVVDPNSRAKTKWKSSTGSSGTDTSTDGGRDADADMAGSSQG